MEGCEKAATKTATSSTTTARTKSARKWQHFSDGKISAVGFLSMVTVYFMAASTEKLILLHGNIRCSDQHNYSCCLINIIVISCMESIITKLATWMQNFIILASLFSLAGWIEPYLVKKITKKGFLLTKPITLCQSSNYWFI